MSETRAALSPSEQTRRALVDAAITLFGRDGYRGTSIRAIARMAGTNVASIAYHFGGKEALRMACGDVIAERVAGVVGDAALPEVDDPQQAMRILEGVLTAFVHYLLLHPDEANFVAFMTRELAEGGPVIDAVYETTFAPRHRAFCRLWEAATGWPAESDRTRLTVFSMIGQVLYFRIGQSIVQRRMGWDRLDPEKVRQITDVLITNLRAARAAAERTAP